MNATMFPTKLMMKPRHSPVQSAIIERNGTKFGGGFLLGNRWSVRSRINRV